MSPPGARFHRGNITKIHRVPQQGLLSVEENSRGRRLVKSRE